MRTAGASSSFPDRTRRGRYALALSAVLLALIYCGYRGVWRGVESSRDLTVGYSAARAWLAGENPYDHAELNRLLAEAGGGDVDQTPGEGLPNVYLPPTLLVFVPVALFPWPAAKGVWLGVNLLCIGGIWAASLRLAGIRWNSERALWLGALLLALAPVHTTLAIGQISIVATMAILGAMLLERAQRPVRAGALYGMAVALKVQIGLPFVAYLLWRRRWRAAAAALAAVGGLSLLSITRLRQVAPAWSESLAANLRGLTEGGGADATGSTAHHLLNLHYGLHAFVESHDVVNALAILLVLGAALLLVRSIRGRYPAQELLAMSGVAVLTLLVTYHRTYDAVLIALPVAWAFAAWDTQRRPYAIAVIALSLTFVVPGQALAYAWTDRVPHGLANSLFWSVIALRQYVWVLVAITVVVLLAAMQRDDDGDAAIAESP